MNIFSKKNKKAGRGDPFFIQDAAEKDFYLGDSRNLDWVEENIDFDEKKNFAGADVFNNEKKEFLGLALDAKRLKFFLFFIFGVLTLLLGKTAYLQIIKGNYYREIAEGNRIRTLSIAPERGIIYDKEMRPLVSNIPTFSLYLIPSDFPKKEEERLAVIGSLAKIIKVNPVEIENILSGLSPYSYLPALLKTNIDYEEAIHLKIESARLPGIDLRLESRREYFHGISDGDFNSLSHIVGYVGKINEKELKEKNNYIPTDFIGKSGLELVYEDVLRGEPGKKQIEVDALGKEKRVIAKEDPLPGKNIILTIDGDLQKKTEEILARHIVRANKKRAVMIVMNPQSGEILSMVSLPSFDNNIFVRGISSKDYEDLIGDPDKPLFNRAVMGSYPSGSTFKPIVAAAALEEGIIKKNTSFLSTGGLRISSWFFPDWRAGGHGWSNVARAIAESINTFFYIIGGGYEDFQGLGVDKIVEYAKLFGFGERLGIDLPNESNGFLPTKEWKEKVKSERWYIGDTYHLSIGQGDLTVTPLQICAATVVFANGGILYQPHFFESTESFPENKNEEKKIIRKDFINKENINIVRMGMRQAVLSGSAVKLLNLPVSSAGKTGTAQWQTKKPPHAWFTAFAPYENPEVVVTVLVEEGEEGSRISLDIAYEFLMWYFSR